MYGLVNHSSWCVCVCCCALTHTHTQIGCALGLLSPSSAAAGVSVLSAVLCFALGLVCSLSVNTASAQPAGQEKHWAVRWSSNQNSPVYGSNLQEVIEGK